jgi:hypothetical protein
VQECALVRDKEQLVLGAAAWWQIGGGETRVIFWESFDIAEGV